MNASILQNQTDPLVGNITSDIFVTTRNEILENQTSMEKTPVAVTEENLSFNILLAITFGPLAVTLLVSYVIHWYHVMVLVFKNREMRMMGSLETPHSKTATIGSIKSMEREKSEIMDIDELLSSLL